MPKSGSSLITLFCAACVIAFALLAGCGKYAGKPPLATAANLMLNRPEAAMTAVDQYLRDHPDDPDALTLRFLLDLKLEKFTPAAETLVRLPEAPNVMTRALFNNDSDIRAGAARLICDRSLLVSSSRLIEALDDSNPTVRRYCAATLGHRREQRALKPLFRLIGDDNWYVRAQAAESLGQLGDPRAAGWLVQMLNESDGFVRLNAAVALRQVAAAENHDVLQKAYAGSKPPKQIIIAIALAKLHDPTALDSLTNAVTASDPSLRRRVAEALGDYPAALVTNALLQLGQDTNTSVQVEAKQSLRRVQRPDGGT